jgi:hypothetical protein
LKNDNALQNNKAAIDLKDDLNHNCFQITSTSLVKKVQETLNKFVEHGLQKDFESLYVLVLGKKQKSYPSLKVPADFSFNASENILDFRNLLQHISLLSNAKLARLVQLFAETEVKKEMPTLVKAANQQKKT